MSKFIKFFLLILIVSTFMFNSGCGIPGTTGPKTEGRTVTLTGDVVSPVVKIPGFLPSVFDSLVSSSTCTVNDAPVTYTIASDSTFTIINVPYASAYQIHLQAGNLNLYSYVPGADTSIIKAPFGISNRSTAEYFIRKFYAQDIAVPLNTITPYSVDISLVNELATTISSSLSNASSSLALLNTALANKKAEFLKRKSFFKALTVSNSPSYYDKTWDGDVYYNILDSRGKKAASISAEAKFNINVAGDRAFGNAEIIPNVTHYSTGTSTFQNIASTLSFYFEGKIKDGVVQFRRRGVNGTVEEPLLEEWTLFPVAGGLAVKSKNIDFKNRGIEFDPAKSTLN